MINPIQPLPHYPVQDALGRKPVVAPPPPQTCATEDCLQIAGLKLPPATSAKVKKSLASSSQAAKASALKSAFTGSILGAEAGWAAKGLSGAAVGAVVGGTTSALHGTLKTGAFSFVKGTVADKPAGHTLLQTLQAMPSPAGSQCIVIQPGWIKDR